MSPTVYPLSWPSGWKRASAHYRSPFGEHSLGRTVDSVLNELRLLGASEVVISTNLKVRLDGLPMSGQRRPDDPGVAVYFKLVDVHHRKQDRVLACDKWETVEENLWAIVKHIEAIRGQDRWGVGTIDQAFLGYAALPSGESGVNPFLVLGLEPYASVDAIEDAYRSKARRAHPDAGGSHEAMSQLNLAREMALRARR